MGYQILSPDGITIDCNVTSYKSKEEALESFEEWKKRFEGQGYYSSPQYGRIPLDELADYCSLITV